MRKRLAILVMVGALSTGCALTVDGQASPGDQNALSRTINDVVGAWHGTYTCAQGETDLSLVVERKSEPGSDTPRGTAIFTFGPLPSNPGVERGSYRMVVTRDYANTFRFTQKEWIVRPASYLMVDLIGELHGDKTISGGVSGPACTSFSVTRSR